MNGVNNLLQRAKKGDDQALGALLEMYRNYLNMLARLQIEPSLRGKLSSSDLVQETFLNAKRGLAGFRGQTERELMAWLRRIMANRLTDAVRRYGGLGRENVAAEVRKGLAKLGYDRHGPRRLDGEVNTSPRVVEYDRITKDALRQSICSRLASY